MKLKNILESISKSISDVYDKDSDVYKSEQYFFAAQAFKELKKKNFDKELAKKLRAERCKDPRCAKAFDKMVSKQRHYLSDDERAEIGL